MYKLMVLDSNNRETVVFENKDIAEIDYFTYQFVNKKELLDCIDRATLFVKEGDKKPIILNILDFLMYFLQFIQPVDLLHVLNFLIAYLVYHIMLVW